MIKSKNSDIYNIQISRHELKWFVGVILGIFILTIILVNIPTEMDEERARQKEIFAELEKSKAIDLNDARAAQTEQNIINENSELESNTIINSDNSPTLVDSFSNAKELHWTHMPITYKFESECGERQVNRTKAAFRTIQTETSGVVYFNETDENPDISIYCRPESNFGFVDNKKTLSDALCEKKSLDSNLIIKGKYNIYEPMACGTGYPAVEVHEILHLFGFEHNPDSLSVMTTLFEGVSKDCKTTRIDLVYISCLKNIYSNGLIEGNCSKIRKVLSSENNEVCVTKCPSGFTHNQSGACVEECAIGYTYDENFNCVQECGEGYYCIKDSYCCSNECFSCEEGYYLGSDCECYPN